MVPGWTGSGASSPDAPPGRTERAESVFRDACDYAASGVGYAGATAGRGYGRAGVTEVWGGGCGEVRMGGDWDFSRRDGYLSAGLCLGEWWCVVGKLVWWGQRCSGQLPGRLSDGEVFAMRSLDKLIITTSILLVCYFIFSSLFLVKY